MRKYTSFRLVCITRSTVELIYNHDEFTRHSRVHLVEVISFRGAFYSISDSLHMGLSNHHQVPQYQRTSVIEKPFPGEPCRIHKVTLQLDR